MYRRWKQFKHIGHAGKQLASLIDARIVDEILGGLRFQAEDGERREVESRIFEMQEDGKTYMANLSHGEAFILSTRIIAIGLAFRQCCQVCVRL